MGSGAGSWTTMALFGNVRRLGLRELQVAMYGFNVSRAGQI